MGLSDSVATINSLIRTLLALVVVGGISVASWWGYSTFTANERQEQELADTRVKLEQRIHELKEKEAKIEQLGKTIDGLEVDLEQKQIEIDRLDTALRLMKVDHRVARLTVTEQKKGADGNDVTTTVEFVEIDDDGKPIDAPKVFEIKGDMIYIDSWVVKFDDEYVQKADLHRATSLVLFRRIFGEYQNPSQGHSLDSPDKLRPKAYGDGQLSEFEKKIWQDFWTIANDETKARKIGIRAAHGDAPSMKVEKGRSYRVLLRASGGLSIAPEGNENTAPAG